MIILGKNSQTFMIPIYITTVLYDTWCIYAVMYTNPMSTLVWIEYFDICLLG